MAWGCWGKHCGRKCEHPPNNGYRDRQARCAQGSENGETSVFEAGEGGSGKPLSHWWGGGSVHSWLTQGPMGALTQPVTTVPGVCRSNAGGSCVLGAVGGDRGWDPPPHLLAPDLEFPSQLEHEIDSTCAHGSKSWPAEGTCVWEPVTTLRGASDLHQDAVSWPGRYRPKI